MPEDEKVTMKGQLPQVKARIEDIGEWETPENVAALTKLLYETARREGASSPDAFIAAASVAATHFERQEKQTEL